MGRTVRTGQLSQEQLEPQLQVPEDAQPQLPIVIVGSIFEMLRDVDSLGN